MFYVVDYKLVSNREGTLKNNRYLRWGSRYNDFQRS